MLLITEPLRAMCEVASLPISWNIIKKFNKEVNGVVVTLPGFFGADGSMYMVRRYLTELGCDCYGWGQGRNMGLHDDKEDALEEYLDNISAQHGGAQIHLVGHSLGGIYAREMAKRRPDLISQVITLGSPFNHPEQKDVVSSKVRVLYELINGELTGDEKDIVAQIGIPPLCPTHCLYSKADGVVQYGSCLQDDPPNNVENVEVFGSHAGMGHNPLILYIIADRIKHHQTTKYKKVA